MDLSGRIRTQFYKLLDLYYQNFVVSGRCLYHYLMEGSDRGEGGGQVVIIQDLVEIQVFERHKKYFIFVDFKYN